MYRNTTFHKNDGGGNKAKKPSKVEFCPAPCGAVGQGTGPGAHTIPQRASHFAPTITTAAVQPEERQVPRKVRLVFFQPAGLIQEINSPYKICPVNAILAWHVAR